LLVLLLDVEEILLGSARMFSVDHFTTMWREYIRLFDEKAETVSLQWGARVLFTDVEVCGNCHAVCKKLENLLKTLFVPKSALEATLHRTLHSEDEPLRSSSTSCSAHVAATVGQAPDAGGGAAARRTGSSDAAAVADSQTQKETGKWDRGTKKKQQQQVRARTRSASDPLDRGEDEDDADVNLNTVGSDIDYDGNNNDYGDDDDDEGSIMPIYNFPLPADDAAAAAVEEEEDGLEAADLSVARLALADDGAPAPVNTAGESSSSSTFSFSAPMRTIHSAASEDLMAVLPGTIGGELPPALPSLPGNGELLSPSAARKPITARAGSVNLSDYYPNIGAIFPAIYVQMGNRYVYSSVLSFFLIPSLISYP
jgi:hypothetical protein